MENYKTTISTVINILESFAHPSLQEKYDNCGLLTGDASSACKGILCTLDVTEAVITEAIEKNCNLILAHHPIIFKGLKKVTAHHYIERIIIKAIKNDIAIYAIHTNLDNVQSGVNKIIADKIGVVNQQILASKQHQLLKLFVFVPVNYIEAVRQAIFDAGGGHIGNYAECSFQVIGEGTFKANENTQPFVGKQNQLHSEKEAKLEIIFPAWLQSKIEQAVTQAHPYEEVAYDVVLLENKYQNVGSGLIGSLPSPISEKELLTQLKGIFGLSIIKHTKLLNQTIQKVAICGGAGGFLISKAKAMNADVFITSDLKYHDFFEAGEQMLVADIGHWESEQFTADLLIAFLQPKFPTFAVLKSEVNTNPVQYFL
jgi:dinuclear metal center YbgI/SA1388 family protein